MADSEEHPEIESDVDPEVRLKADPGLIVSPPLRLTLRLQPDTDPKRFPEDNHI